jgi:hypothetical protein
LSELPDIRNRAKTGSHAPIGLGFLVHVAFIAARFAVQPPKGW